MRKHWPWVGTSVVEVINNFFQTGHLPTKLNATTIIYIPKKNNPVSVADFWPISLCNVIYKVIVSVIMSRLRPFMSDIISPFQNAFVPKRNISDSTLLAHEILHTMHKKRGKGGALAMNFDLEKAYDKLEWGFLKQEHKLPPRWVELIMECVYNSVTYVLINGKLSAPIHMTRGLRQGDPLSPYLFIIAMDYFIRAVWEASHAKKFLPLSASRSGPPIPILCTVLYFPKLRNSLCAT